MLNISKNNHHLENRDNLKRNHRSSYSKSKHDELLLLQRPTILSKSRTAPHEPDKITIINKKDENQKPLSKSDSHDTLSKTVNKIESEFTKLVLKPANQQSAPKPLIFQPVPKDPINIFNSSIQARLTTPCMKNSCKLLDDNLQFAETLDQYLSEYNENFTVIGILGKQGVGKSTLMNFLSGCDTSDKFVFKQGDLETAENKTNGIDVFISKERTIFLDVQALLSAAVLEKNNFNEQSKKDFKYCENYVQMQSIELACFCLSICNSVLVMEDWFLDPNLLTLLHTAEMLLPNMSELEQSYEHSVNLVYCLNKCNYLSRVDLINMKRVFANLMKDSKLLYKGDIGEMKEFNGLSNMDKSIKNLLKELLSIRKPSQTGFTEKKWFYYAGKVWETIKKSSLISEYSRLMT
ncbi:unnamed protein product [Brachionus calyciflorus]|uniref:SMG9 n=1 Tax=Brachionus calyciflorus TaxID=104777 RepID=A0A814FPT0_9BILA|nr:unnamed protein product [Brachionus calyciflorus]